MCEGNNVLCKRCETIIGHVIKEDEDGIFVRLSNFRLVEYQPLHVDAEDATRRTLVSRINEIPNHLKRKADSDINQDGFYPKYFRPNDDEPICLMRVFVPPTDTIESISLPEFDINDTFSDISDFENTLDINLDDIIPFLHDTSPMINLNSTASDTSESTPPSISSEDGIDSDIEFVPNSPADSDVEYIPYTPPGKNSNLKIFR